jgi:hypothetical protein
VNGYGSRLAKQYQRLSTSQLRQSMSYIRNQRRRTAVELVLAQRHEAYQASFDSAQSVLDSTGGSHAADLHASALSTAMARSERREWLDAERAMGVADAIWDYIRERADT